MGTKDDPRRPRDASTPDSEPNRPGSIRRLAGELLELAGRDPKSLSTRVATLTVREQAELVLCLPPRDRLELLLHAPRPMRLVRALPDADFYLTVREIGPADATPLIALASAEQIQHLLDLESWRRDRFDAERGGAWVALLLEVGEPALQRFLRRADEELLALLTQSWIRVAQIEYEDGAEVHGHGEGEAGTEQGFLTPDGYHRFSPRIVEHVPAIRRLLQVFFQSQPNRYQRVLWRALGELPAELEEQALKWRQSRLEEHGFPPWDEALAVYAPPSGSTRHPAAPRPTDPDGLVGSRTLVSLLADRGPLVEAIDSLDGDLRDRTLHGLVSLANHLLVADAADTGDPGAHQRALEKAAGYLRIAFEQRGARLVPEAMRVLEEVPVLELFREGHEEAVRLQRRARRIFKEGWGARISDAPRWLDSPLRERIEALLLPRPLYLDAEEERFRDFADSAEIVETRAAVEMAEAVGKLFVERLGLDVHGLAGAGEPEYEDRYRFSTAFLTVLAWHAMSGEIRGDALPSSACAEFLRNVASRRTADEDAPERTLQRMIDALSERFRLLPRESSVLLAFGRFCLERLAEECGDLDPGVPVDARYVQCLLLED